MIKLNVNNKKLKGLGFTSMVKHVINKNTLTVGDQGQCRVKVDSKTRLQLSSN